MGVAIMVSPNRGQAPHIPSLASQGSLYNLTLDEFQNQLGDLEKPLNTMNLDDLLKMVMAAEDTQVIQNEVGSSANQPTSSVSFPGNTNLARTLSQKTVDEVWNEIVLQEQGNASRDEPLQRQPTLGEMTLEDFLVRAGAINMENQSALANSQSLVAMDPIGAVVTQQDDWMHYQMTAVDHQQQLVVLGPNLPIVAPIFGNPIVGSGYAENQMALTVPVASDSWTTGERKRRFSDEMLEKTIERRQKRMIKNRESAARSRQKKQAYTSQLEQKVSTLTKTNEELKKELDLQLWFNFDETESKYQLRRTASAPF